MTENPPNVSLNEEKNILYIYLTFGNVLELMWFGHSIRRPHRRLPLEVVRAHPTG